VSSVIYFVACCVSSFIFQSCSVRVLGLVLGANCGFCYCFDSAPCQFCEFLVAYFPSSVCFLEYIV